MKNISVLILVIAIGIVLSLFLFSFQVRETEKAIVMRFGKHVRTVDEPGWKLKWPIPIDVVYKYDSRLNLYERPMEETTTRGGNPIIVTSYMIWGVGDPLKFHKRVKTTEIARDYLYSLLGSAQNAVVGRHYFSDFVNTDPSKVMIEQIEGEMLSAIQNTAGDKYGIAIKSVGIKQLAISEKVTEAVFKRMEADRSKIANETLSQGQAQAKRIRSDADAKSRELLAMVDAQAKAIRGQGDAEAATHYARLEIDPELAMFLRKLESLKKILAERTTLVIGTDFEPLDLLKGIPDLEPSR